MSIGLFVNSIQSAYYSFIGWFIPFVVSAGVYVYDHIHFPNYSIYIDGAISYTTQLYVEDIQLGVKYTRNRNGAILGYVGADELIDVTNYVAHVTLEGTIIIWSRDDDPDPDGMFCVIIPFNMQVQHLYPDGQELEVVPQPETAQKFTSTDIRWKSTDVPGHFFISSPRVNIDLKWNRDDNYPYVSTTYFPQVTSRFDDKRYEPEFRASGTDIDSFRLKPPQIGSADFTAQMDLAALYISMIKHKFDVEPLTLKRYRRFYL